MLKNAEMIFSTDYSLLAGRRSGSGLLHATHGGRICGFIVLFIGQWQHDPCCSWCTKNEGSIPNGTSPTVGADNQPNLS